MNTEDDRRCGECEGTGWLAVGNLKLTTCLDCHGSGFVPLPVSVLAMKTVDNTDTDAAQPGRLQAPDQRLPRIAPLDKTSQVVYSGGTHRPRERQ